MGWFGRRAFSVSSSRARGNFCFKAFEVRQKTLGELHTHCSKFSSSLVTNELINVTNSTLKGELDFVIQRKLRLSQGVQRKIFGLNLDLEGLFSNSYNYKTFFFLKIYISI